ncbi:MAG: methyltransferase domain-containing protein [Candidatus Omnitrophica bacterium]|nr:methyltransferase domain-containing protein [Candidatus Omnitrophota bacterium]
MINMKGNAVKNDEKNFLLETVINIFANLPKGKVLDLGCGDGEFAKKLKDLGFDVVASDMDQNRFKYHKNIIFQASNLEKELPFEKKQFNYVLLLETIEHVYNPDFVIGEIGRVLRSGGTLILSTPNILNLNSRVRFLFEGNFVFFREPILDYCKVFPSGLQNMHLIPWRFQELEYLLFKNHLLVENIYTDLMKPSLKFLWFLLALPIKFASWHKERRTAKKGGIIDYRRINKILLSKELLFGRHLIIQATNL